MTLNGESAAAERVFAPASERVPVDPVPGHRQVVDHPDTHTPEREAVGQVPEPPVVRVNRPAAASFDTPTPAPYASTLTNPAYTPYNDAAWNSESRSNSGPFGMAWGWALLGVGGGVGGWLFLRWRRERNKPINRLRRKAMETASELREHVPSTPEEAVRPAAGLTTALISLAIILWQQSQARSHAMDKEVTRQVTQQSKKAGKRASNAVSDLDLEKRLTNLKKRWNPSRLELEKIQISRH